MKTLKFKGHLVENILNGTKTVTWRLFDDKSLIVGDKLAFINSDIEEEFAKAKITNIQEKKLSEIEDSDYEGHEKYQSQEDMLQHYKGYYGDTVTPDTTVKIIKFELTFDFINDVGEYTDVQWNEEKDALDIHFVSARLVTPELRQSGPILIELSDSFLEKVNIPIISRLLKIQTLTYGTVLPCPNCKTIGFYGAKKYPSSGEITRKYRACKFCGLWQEAWGNVYNRRSGGGKPYIITHSTCTNEQCKSPNWTEYNLNKLCESCNTKTKLSSWALNDSTDIFHRFKEEILN